MSGPRFPDRTAQEAQAWRERVNIEDSCTKNRLFAWYRTGRVLSEARSPYPVRDPVPPRADGSKDRAAEKRPSQEVVSSSGVIENLPPLPTPKGSAAPSLSGRSNASSMHTTSTSRSVLDARIDTLEKIILEERKGRLQVQDQLHQLKEMMEKHLQK